MFQSGEVDYVVATDAIGMGLNLDIAHVAFAAVRKFDGSQVRELADAELAQIAGRAGRYVRDGTFGGLEGVVIETSVARAPSLIAFHNWNVCAFATRTWTFLRLPPFVAHCRCPLPGHILPPRARPKILERSFGCSQIR